MQNIKRVDVVFCFDDKMAKYVSVAIKSLLSSQISKEFKYWIHCITVSEGKKIIDGYLRTLKNDYNFSIKYYLIKKNIFSNSFEVRNITSATYYRFLIPDLLINIEKVIYLDVDILIRGELFDLMQYEMRDIYFRGVKAYLNLPQIWKNHCKQEYWHEMEKCYGKYINAGILLMNLKAIRKSGIVEKWKKLTINEYIYQDQDIINLTCNEKCSFLPLKYNMMVYFNDNILSRMEKEKIYTELEIKEAVCNPVIIHFNGAKAKPWKTFLTDRRYMTDEWWAQVFNDKVLFEWFRDDLMNCIKGCQDESENIFWKAKRNNANYLFMNEWLKLKQQGYSFINVLKKKKYSIVAIYGMSHIGQRLYDELRNSDIEVKYGIDRVNSNKHEHIEIYNPDEDLPWVDAIIVTAIFSYDEIVRKLSKKVEFPIISIEDLIIRGEQ